MPLFTIVLTSHLRFCPRKIKMTIFNREHLDFATSFWNIFFRSRRPTFVDVRHPSTPTQVRRRNRYGQEHTGSFRQVQIRRNSIQMSRQNSQKSSLWERWSSFILNSSGNKCHLHVPDQYLTHYGTAHYLISWWHSRFSPIALFHICKNGLFAQSPKLVQLRIIKLSL